MQLDALIAALQAVRTESNKNVDVFITGLYGAEVEDCDVTTDGEGRVKILTDLCT